MRTVGMKRSKQRFVLNPIHCGLHVTVICRECSSELRIVYLNCLECSSALRNVYLYWQECVMDVGFVYLQDLGIEEEQTPAGSL
jgi:hypothetical protein